MNTILIFVLKKENLIKVVYTQGGSPKQSVEEYPDTFLAIGKGQVKIFNNDKAPTRRPVGHADPELVVPVSRTIIKFVE